MPTYVPFDPSYTALVGTAVYVFAYYEWQIIYLIQQFKPEFVHTYCRGAPITSGGVRKALGAIVSDAGTCYTAVPKAELQACYEQFGLLVDKRNAMIHAHPITGHDGAQILNYQARVDRPLPDMEWSVAKLEAAIREFDDAARNANALLHRMFRGARMAPSNLSVRDFPSIPPA